MREYSKQEKERMILGTLPEELSCTELQEISIPGLRERLNELLRVPKQRNGFRKQYDFICNYQEWNYRAINIVERAMAICGDVKTMTVHELNQSVKILREEIYLVQIEIQKQEERLNKNVKQ